MTPTPMSMADPLRPTGYTWEATDEDVAARYGIPLEQIVRFDVNTSPTPPALIERLLAAGRFTPPLSEYPPTDYRRLVAAASVRYGVGMDELIVGAGADEILDIIAKTFLPPGSAAIVPSPTYAMYRIDTEQRPARVVTVPRLGAAEGYALDLPATRAAIEDDPAIAVVWLCDPNNPTGAQEPDGSIETLLRWLLSDARARAVDPPIVVIDEAYAEFVGTTYLGSRSLYPRLIVIRTASKAYALAGLRVGFGIARPELIDRMNPYRPPGSISTVSVGLVTAALEDPTVLHENLARVGSERDRLAGGLAALGWDVRPSVTNFLLVRLDSREHAAFMAEALLGNGLIPRTFGVDHPLADHLRVTVRDRDENDRFIAVAAAGQRAWQTRTEESRA